MDSKHTNDNHENNGLRGRIPYDMPDDDELNLADLLPVIWRGKWIIAAVTLAVFIIALVITITLEPEYEAEVSVFINTQGQKASQLLGGLTLEDHKNVANELELLKSRMIAENAAEELLEQRYLDDEESDPIPILTSFDEERNALRWVSADTVTQRLRRVTSFDAKRDTDFINITVRRNNNREAALIANTFAQVYYDRHFQLSRQQSRSVREFLEGQMDDKQAQLQEAEQEFREYMEDHGVVEIDNETKRVIDHIAELEAQREATGVEIQSLSSTHASLQQQLAEQEPHVARNISSADNPYIRMIQEQIAELEVERDLTLTQNPGAQDDQRYDRMLAEIDDQLNNLRENLRRRTDDFMQSMAPSAGDDPAGYVKQLRQRLLETDIEMQGLRYRKAAIDESLERYESQFDRLPQVAMEYARLQRARTSSEKLYLMLEERYNEALITEQSEFGSVDIIDRALVPSSPVSPNTRMNLLLGLLLGGGLGIGFVIARERIFAPVRIPEDLRKGGYDTLTTVSSMDRDLRKLYRNGSVAKNGKQLDPHLIMISNPLSPAAESYRLLRTNLQFAQVDYKLSTIAVTSPSPGEGKTTTVSNMGIAYAQAGERVLLVDCDLRKPSLAEEFDVVTKPGLTEVLANEHSYNDVIQQTVVDNLDILSCGTLPSNPAELLGSKKMKTLLKTLSGRYDIILCDTPPVLAASDPLVLSTVTDGVVMVVASSRTRMKELDLSRDSLTRIGSRITGVVLNFFDYRQAYGSSYKYKYYRYGKYGSYGYSKEDQSKLKEVKVDS